jgi:hypothetical protein
VTRLSRAAAIGRMSALGGAGNDLTDPKRTFDPRGRGIDGIHYESKSAYNLAPKRASERLREV